MMVEHATLALVGGPGLVEALAIIQGHTCHRVMAATNIDDGVRMTALLLMSPGAGETPEQAVSDAQMIVLATKFLEAISAITGNDFLIAVRDSGNDDPYILRN